MNKDLKCIINSESFDCFMNKGNSSFILATRRGIVTKLHGYLKEFRIFFLKNCTSETEINIKENIIDDIGWGRLKVLENDSKALDFHKNINEITKDWIMAINRQPQCDQNTNLAIEILEMIKNKITGFVLELQEDVLRKKKDDENLECDIKCKDGPKIFNFTAHTIDQDIIKQLEKGLGYVPHTKERRELITDRIETEIKKAAFSYFYKINGFRPPNEIFSLEMTKFIKQMLIFSPASPSENEFFHRLKENLEKAITNINFGNVDGDELDNLAVFDNMPIDTIVTIADKNIGIALVPIQWFIDEYHRQQIKGGFENVNLDEKECIAKLDYCIDKFREACNAEQKQMIKKFWPKATKNKRIGTLKLVPKVHKLKGEINELSWESLTGRPIRGAEQCPTNAPSIALCKMIQEMLADLKGCYRTLAPGSVLASLSFPIIKGCDAYSSALNDINLLTESFSSTYLVSADFSDAYTLSLRLRLQESINLLGNMLDYTTSHISLMIGLVNIVFDNVYFFSIFGLQRSTKGYPMGGHSSRDALDIDLLRSEIELLSTITLHSAKIHYYGRMVDDVSVVLQGSYDDLTKVLITMATTYPNMPLNVQISQNFSKFLDMNVFNFIDVEHEDSYKLTTTLSWKKQNSYNYVSEQDNKSPRYKGAVVPITMTRIVRRCTRYDEQRHHRDFIFKILKTRGQCPVRVGMKTRNFIKRLKTGKKVEAKVSKDGIRFSTTFDGVSKSHEITEGILRRSMNKKFAMLYKSLPSMAAKICPKRKILAKVTEYYKK